MTEPWLLVQEGSKLFLLAKDQHNFILISVNKNLTDEAEERLCRRAITPQLLTEMGLTFRLLPKGEIRGVALSGTEAGETIWIYPVSGKKQKYVFSDDYSREQMDTFFAGTQRFTAPGTNKKKKGPDAWRLEGRNQELYEKLWFVSPLLMCLNLACGIGYLNQQNWQWYLACFACAAVPVVLDILFPAYFTLLPEQKKNVESWNLLMPLAIHTMLVMIQHANWVEGRMYLIVGLLCGLGAVILMGTLALEFKKNKPYLIALFLVAAFCCIPEVRQINRVFDFSEPQVYTLTVEDLEYDDREIRSCRCFTTLPDGREAKIYIHPDLYATLDIGDPIRVEVYPGALGIEYARAYPVE